MADIAELMRKLHKDKITVSIDWLEQCVGYIRQELRPPEARLLLEIQVIILIIIEMVFKARYLI